MITKETMKRLEALGIEWASPSHPIYSEPPRILFMNQSKTSTEKQTEKTDSPQQTKQGQKPSPLPESPSQDLGLRMMDEGLRYYVREMGLDESRLTSSPLPPQGKPSEKE